MPTIGVVNGRFFSTSAEKLISDAFHPRSNPQFETNIRTILRNFRATRDNASHKALIIHVYHESHNPHSPLHTDSPGIAFQSYACPDVRTEIVLSKNVNSCFIGTPLEGVLRAKDIRRLYIVGLTTDHCVSTTVRMAGNLKVTDWINDDGETKGGDGVFLIEDATATFSKGGFGSDIVHKVNVESLKEFAAVVTTKDVMELFAP